MGFLTTMIHRWAPAAQVQHIDTVFRAPLLADEPVQLTAVVTDIDEETGVVELDLSVKNNADETRVFGTARVRLPTR
jgi:acyl dehydratase